MKKKNTNASEESAGYRFTTETSKKANARHYKYPYKRVYSRLVSTAQKKNLELDITYEEYLEFTKEKHCYYCNDIIPWKAHGKSANSYFLDRKKAEVGYTKENCVVCCKTCNFFKLRLTEAQFLSLIHKIYHNLLS